MAELRNDTHSLNPDERDAVIVMHAPCVELQQFMSESLDSDDGKELLV
jgi:hypothetical protein